MSSSSSSSSSEDEELVKLSEKKEDNDKEEEIGAVGVGSTGDPELDGKGFFRPIISPKHLVFEKRPGQEFIPNEPIQVEVIVLT